MQLNYIYAHHYEYVLGNRKEALAAYELELHRMALEELGQAARMEVDMRMLI